jgi:hypothetical protein
METMTATRRMLRTAMATSNSTKVKACSVRRGAAAGGRGDIKKTDYSVGVTVGDVMGPFKVIGMRRCRWRRGSFSAL